MTDENKTTVEEAEEIQPTEEPESTVETVMDDDVEIIDARKKQSC
jgi:hypothetical protein